MTGPLRVALVTVGDPDRISGGSIYQRRVVARAAQHGATVRIVSVPERRFPLAVVDGARVLRDAGTGADVVVVDSLASNTLGPWLAAGRCRLPLVGSLHQGLGGIDNGLVRTAVQRFTDRWAWSASDRLVVTSESLAAELRADGVPGASMRVAPPGCDLPPAADEAGPELRHGRTAAALCVGNWLPRKGIVDVLDAVARTPASSTTLHLVGDEDVDPRYRRRIEQRIARPDLVGRVVRHGIVPPSAMSALYAGADVFVLASTVEPYGMVYGEALSAGLPVVGWAAGNLPHLVDDGVEGFTVDVGDVVALGHRLAELAAEPELRQLMSTAASTRGRKLPTWDDTAERFFAACREAHLER